MFGMSGFSWLMKTGPVLVGCVLCGFASAQEDHAGRVGQDKALRSQAANSCFSQQKFIDTFGPPQLLKSQPTSYNNGQYRGQRPHSILQIESWGYSKTFYNPTYGVPGAIGSYDKYFPQGWVHDVAKDTDFRLGMAEAFLCSLLKTPNPENARLLELWLKDNDKKLNEYTDFGSDEVKKFEGRCEGRALKQAQRRAQNKLMFQLVSDLKKIQEENKDNEEILDFLFSVFTQTKSNEEGFAQGKTQVQLTSQLKDQVDKVVSLLSRVKANNDLNESETKFLKFFKEFTQGANEARFQYLVNPEIGKLIASSVETLSSPSNSADAKHLESARAKIGEVLGQDSLSGTPKDLAGITTVDQDSVTPVIVWAYRHFLNRKDTGGSDPGRQSWIDKVKNGELGLWDAVDRIRKSEEAKKKYTENSNSDGVDSAYEIFLGRKAGSDAKAYRDRANKKGPDEVIKIAKEIFNSEEGTKHRCEKETSASFKTPEDPGIRKAEQAMEKLRVEEIDNPKFGKEETPLRNGRNNLLANLAEHAPHGLWNTPEGARLKRLTQRALQSVDPNSDTSTQVQDFADNKGLNKTVTALSDFAKQFKIPYDASVAGVLLNLDPIYGDLLKHLSGKNIQLSDHQKSDLKEFLEKGSLDKLMAALFDEKNPTLFKATADFISKTSPEFKELFDEMTKYTSMPKGASARYSELRSKLRKQFTGKLLGDLSAEEKKKLFGLMLLDEWGLKGVTSRDKADRKSSDYDINVFLSELNREKALLDKICKGNESCEKETDTALVRDAQAFLGSYTGITPTLRTTLLERKLAEPQLKKIAEIEQRLFKGEVPSEEDKKTWEDSINLLTEGIGDHALSFSTSSGNYLAQVGALYDPKSPKRQEHYFSPITRAQVAGLDSILMDTPGKLEKPTLVQNTEDTLSVEDYQAELKRYSEMSPAQKKKVADSLEARKKQRQLNYDLVNGLKPFVLRAFSSARTEEPTYLLKNLFHALTLVSPDTNSKLGVQLAAYASYPEGSSLRKALVGEINSELKKLLTESSESGAEDNTELSEAALDAIFKTHENGFTLTDTKEKRGAFEKLDSDVGSVAKQLSQDLAIPEHRVQRLLAIQDESARAQAQQALPLSLAHDPRAAQRGFEGGLLRHLQSKQQLAQPFVTPALRQQLMPSTALPQPASQRLKEVIEELRKMGLSYEPLKNELMLQPWATLDNKEKIEALLKELPPVSMRLQIEGGQEVTLPRRNALEAFKDALMRRAATFGVSLFDSKFDFADKQKFNDQKAPEKFLHKWFPVSENVVARIMRHNGELKYELKSMDELRNELRGSIASINQLRADIARNEKDTGSFWRSWRNLGDESVRRLINIFDPELGNLLDSNHSEEKIEVERLDRALGHMEAFIRGSGSIPIPGSDIRAEDYASGTVRRIRSDAAKRNSEALNTQIRNVENIYDGIFTLATIPVGGVALRGVSVLSKLSALEKLSKTGNLFQKVGARILIPPATAAAELERLAATGSVAQRLSAKSAQVLLKSVGAIPGSVQHGLKTATIFQGIGSTVAGSVELAKLQFGETYINERLEEARKNPLGWKKWKVTPDELEKYKDPNSRKGKEYEAAWHEYDIEHQLDVNGDGYIDMLREETKDIGYTQDIASRLSDAVFNGDQLDRYLGSVQFFSNLHFVGHGTGAVGKRLIGGKPIVEMPVAATLTNLQNYLFRPSAWAERVKALEEKAKREGKTYQPKSAAHELWDVIYDDAKENLISGAVFSGAIGLNNGVMGSLGLKNPGLGKQLFGTASFMASDLGMKEADHWLRHGKSQFAGMDDWHLADSLIDHLSTAAYIGWGSSKGFLQSAQLKSQQNALLQNGAAKYREQARKETEERYRKNVGKAPGEALSEQQQREVNQELDYHVEGILRSIEARQYEQASGQTIQDFKEWREGKLKQSQEALQEMKNAVADNPELKSSVEALEVRQRELQRLLDEGPWNKVSEIRKANYDLDVEVRKIMDHIERERSLIETAKKEQSKKLRAGQALAEPAVQELLDREFRLSLLSGQLMQGTRALTHMKEFSGAIDRAVVVLGKDEVAFKSQFGSSGVDVSEAHKAIQKQKSKRKFTEPVIKFLRNNGVVDLSSDALGRKGYGAGLLSDPNPPGAGHFAEVQRAAVETVLGAYRDKASTPIQKKQLVQVLLQISPSEAQKLAQSEYKAASGELKEALGVILGKPAEQPMTLQAP